MKRITIEVGPFEVNCSIVHEGGRAFVVDPGFDAAAIMSALDGNALVPEAILLTHAHFDHIGAIPELQRRWPDLPVYVHPEDAKVITHPLNRMEPMYPAIQMPSNIRDCRGLDAARAIETPGHTPGGVCYYFEGDRLLMSGDTLFAGSVGRTDFPGGSMPTLMDSLRRLVAALPDETVVVPGHGPETTIGAEKLGNPFLQ
ncbi:MAG: MBL fold metallo-hydrolase [Kiritimatiellae bacterium]|nr:MBL fold metallo-hydrolase [Kiritimatiellia bacterium]